ncbi:RNA polymerase sigma factor [Flavitalea flava]
MPELSDEKIMQLVKSGQLSELTELFNRYHVKLYNFFLKMTFDKAVSEDLTQNLFYRILKYRQSFQDGNGSFKSWIYGMARNIHTDHYKQEKRMPDRFKLAERYDRGVSGNYQTYGEEHFEQLELSLARLQPEQREILLLCRYQGLKYEEISKIRGISVSAIKVQVHRAIKQLKALYFKQAQEEGLS